jgi:Superinfection immunity protein
VIIILFLAFYCLPLLVALARKHHNFGPIMIVNLLLGWTVIGWIVALAMANSSTAPITVVIQKEAEK